MSPAPCVDCGAPEHDGVACPGLRPMKVATRRRDWAEPAATIIFGPITEPEDRARSVAMAEVERRSAAMVESMRSSRFRR